MNLQPTELANSTKSVGLIQEGSEGSTVLAPAAPAQQPKVAKLANIIKTC